MARFVKTGMIDFVNKHEPQYGDVTALDFQSSMERVATSREMFADLPAKVRDRFNNDPAELLQFLEDPRNKAEAVLLGLAKDDRKPNDSQADDKSAAPSRRASDEPEAKSTATAEVKSDA